MPGNGRGLRGRSPEPERGLLPLRRAACSALFPPLPLSPVRESALCPSDRASQGGHGPGSKRQRRRGHSEAP